MGHEIFHGGENFCDAGLIIGSQKGCAVSGDQRISDIILQIWKFIRRKGDAIELNGFTIIVMNDMRHDTIAFGIRTGIHMGNKANGRSVGICCRQGSHDIAVTIHYSIS